MIHFTIRPINYKLENYFFKGCTVLGPWALINRAPKENSYLNEKLHRCKVQIAAFSFKHKITN